MIAGGLLGAGQVNTSTIGSLVLPNLQPYKPPYVVVSARPSQQPRGVWADARRIRALFIALVVMVGVFGAMLLGCLGLLIWRLVKAGRQSKQRGVGPIIATTPFEDGIGRLEAPHPHDTFGGGLSSLEVGARRHGASGGI